MFYFDRYRLLPIGIDLGYDAVRMVQLRRERGGGLAVAAAAQKSIARVGTQNTESLIAGAMDEVTSLLALGEFRGRAAVVAPPGEMVNARTVRIPADSAKPPGEIPAEVREAFGFDLSGAMVQLLRAGRVTHCLPEGDEVIALALKREDSEELLSRLRRAGLGKASLETRMMALRRAAFLSGENAGVSTTALLEMGGDAARLLISRDGRVQFLRTLPASSAALCLSLGRALGISVKEAEALRRRVVNVTGTVDASDPVRRAVGDAARGQLEALADEVSRSLRYHAVTFRGRQPERIWVCGEGAADPQLHEFLTAQTGLEVRTARPFGGIDCSAMRAVDRDGDDSRWAVAVALGTKDAAFSGSSGVESARMIASGAAE